MELLPDSKQIFCPRCLYPSLTRSVFLQFTYIGVAIFVTMDLSDHYLAVSVLSEWNSAPLFTDFLIVPCVFLFIFLS